MARRDRGPGLRVPVRRRRPPSPTEGRRPSSSPAGSSRRRAARVLAGLTAGALLLLVLVRVTGTESGAVLALLVGALPLTLLVTYPLLALAAWLRARLVALVCVLLVAAHAAVVAPALGAEPVPAAAGDGARLRVVVANLYRLNPEPERAAELLRDLRPDLLVVPELDERGRRALADAGLTADLPHTAVAEGGEETVGLLSRLPLQDVALRRVGARVLPQATVDVDGALVRVLAVHPLPPLAGLEPLWRATLADTARQAAQEELPLVVAGDLNADRDHAAFRRLLATGLRDAHDERGRGLARTWPSRLPLLHLDHVLVRDGAGAGLVVLAVDERRVPGSDHLAVVADLAVLPAA